MPVLATKADDEELEKLRAAFYVIGSMRIIWYIIKKKIHHLEGKSVSETSLRIVLILHILNIFLSINVNSVLMF